MTYRDEAERYRPFFEFCIDLLLRGMPREDREIAKAFMAAKKKWKIEIAIVDDILIDGDLSRRALGCQKPSPARSKTKKSITCTSEIQIRRDVTENPGVLAIVFIHEFNHAMHDFGIVEASWRYYRQIALPTVEFAEEHSDDIVEFFKHLVVEEAKRQGYDGGDAFIRAKFVELVSEPS